jgi:adenylate cyclase
MIDLLNRSFDCQVPLILEHGAEVLKFMGDGLLAIFAIADNATEVRRRALTAARQAQAKIAASRGQPRRGCGSVWHSTSVMFSAAISTAAIGSISRASVQQSTVLHASKADRPAGESYPRLHRIRALLPGEFTALAEFSLAGFSTPQIDIRSRSQTGAL